MKHQHAHVHFLDYYGYLSKLNPWNAAFKAVFSILNMLICIIADHWLVSIVIAFSMAYMIVGRGKMHLHTYISLLKIPVFFIIFSCIAIAVNISGTTNVHAGVSLGFCYLYITEETLVNGAHVFLKAFGAVSAMYMLTLTTTSDEIIQVLKKCHVPKFIIELMYLIYRYIFVLMDIHENMKQAAQSRVGERDFITSCKTFGKIADNLLIQSIKKAGLYYDAMLARGYDGDLCFLEEEKKVTKAQLMGAAGYFVFIGALIVFVNRF